MSLLRNLFFGRPSWFGLRRQQPAITPRRGGIAFGSLLALVAPFLLRRLRARQPQRAAY